MKSKLFIIIFIAIMFTKVGCCKSEEIVSILHDEAAGYISDYCLIDDKCIIIGANGIFSCDATGNNLELMIPSSSFPEKAYTALLEQQIDIFQFDRKVHCMDKKNYDIYSIDGQNLSLAFSIMDDNMYYADKDENAQKEIERCVSANNNIYILANSFTFEKGRVKQLYLLNRDGTLTLLDEDEISDINYSNSGTLIIQRRLEDKIAIKELSNGQSHTLIEIDDNEIFGMAYDAKMNVFYYTENNGCVKSINDSKCEICSSVPFALLFKTSKAYASENLYYYLQDGNLIIRDTMQGKNDNRIVLRILGMIDEDIILHYEAAHPEIAIEIDKRIETELGLQQAIISEDYSVDMFIVSSDDLFSPVVRKNYYLPLERSKTLLSKSSILYKWLTDVIYKDNHIVAWPIDADVNTWTINVTQWESLGLGSIPKTWFDVLECLQIWNDYFKDDYPNISVLDAQDGIYGIIRDIVRDCIFQSESHNSRSVTETPELITILQSLLEHSSYFDRGEKPLIMPYSQYLGMGYNDQDTVMNILPPSLSDNQERVAYATVDFIVINPLSRYQQEAIDFVEYYAENLDIIKKYMFYSTMTEPIRPNGFEQNVKNMQEQIEKLQSANENDQTISDELAVALLDLNELIENEWLVSQSDINIWSSIANSIYVPIEAAYLGNNDKQSQSINSLIHLFADKKIDINLFFQRLNKILQMIYYESQ